MGTDRRGFLTAAAAGGALGLAAGTPLAGLARSEAGADVTPPPERAPKALRILILGGTNMTGPHNVRYALERGHSVTTFTRGQTKPGLFQDAFQHVEQLIGDRENDLEALRGKTWDAVIDASGMNEAWTRDSAALLKDAAETYLYISSTGVYYPYLTTEIEEDTEVMLEDPSGGENVASQYGVLKALSEIEAQNVFGDRTLIVRPGYIVGPLDKTHRGTYWPERLRRGGAVLAPGKKGDLVQQVDVRDLTEWMIRSLENGTHGVFNVTGPASPTSMEQFVYGVKGAFPSEVSWTWIDDYDFLTEHDVGWAIPWIMPVDDNLGSQRIDIERAKAAGQTFRPIAETAIDTLEWYDSLPKEERSSPPMMITPEHEVEVLAAWQARAR